MPLKQPTPGRGWMQKKALWGAFAAVHVIFLALLSPLIINGQVLSDIQFYREWAYQGINDGVWQGISNAWVYPVGALIPMVLAAMFGHYLYQLGWFVLFTALNALGTAVLAGSAHPGGARIGSGHTGGARNGRSHNGRVTTASVQGYCAAYWWLAATSLLGPVAVGRIDGLTAPLVIAGLLLLAARPILASFLLSLATWIKVWPAAVVAAVLTVSRHRLKLLATGAVLSVAIAAVVAASGGARYLLSFISAQGDRGMQLEAPFTTPGLWQVILGGSDAYIYEDTLINTREVRGALGEPVAALMTPLLALSAGAVVLLLLWALRRGAATGQLVTVGSLALVSAFIVFNKVGSPQFMLWLAAVTAVGLALDGAHWKLPAITMAGIAILTTLVYPMFYAALYDDLNVVIALLLTLRNVLVVGLFGWAVVRIVRLAQDAAVSSADRVQTR